MSRGLCRFTYQGGPLDRAAIMLGNELCECCGEQRYPNMLPYGHGGGEYRREKGSTVFHWQPKEGP